jgi:rubrerythrin
VGTSLIVDRAVLVDKLVSNTYSVVSKEVPMSLTKLLSTRMLNRLVASPRGRAFLLGFMADAEESDEKCIFVTLLARVDDEKLHTLVRTHATDEDRHASLLRAAVARGGVKPEPVPAELRYVLRVERLLGHVGERFVAGRAGEAYVMLGLIEERAVREWPAIVAALAPLDPQTAEVVAGIVEDERRHVRYSYAIARRYAPSEAVLAETVAEYRAVEARAFEQHKAVFLRFALEQDLLDVGPIERAVWRVLATTGERASSALVEA